jgi:hypothetical protein
MDIRILVKPGDPKICRHIRHSDPGSVYFHEGLSRSHGDRFLLGVARIRLQNFQGGLPGRHSAKDNSKERSVAIDTGSMGLACGRDNRQAFFPVHLLDNSNLLRTGREEPTIGNFFYLNHSGIVLQKERNRKQFERARDG